MEQLENRAPAGRDIGADFLRALACFFVVLLHCSGSGSTAAIFINSLTRFSVPVFVIISGRFCLASDSTVGHYLKKCLRLLLTFVLWSALYYCLLVLPYEGFDAAGAARFLVTGPQHFWYIYAAMALYLAAPVLRVFCENADKKRLEYFLLLTFIFGSLVKTALDTSHFALLREIIEEMKAEYMLGFLCLFVFGFYEYRFPPDRKRRGMLYALGAAGLAATFFGTLLLTRRSGAFNDLLFGFFAPNVMLSGAAVYVFFTQRFRTHRPGERAKKVIALLADCSFGIYLAHVLVLDTALAPLDFINGLPAVPAILLRDVMTFCLTALAVWLLRKIKFMRALT